MSKMPQCANIFFSNIKAFHQYRFYTTFLWNVRNNIGHKAEGINFMENILKPNLFN